MLRTRNTKHHKFLDFGGKMYLFSSYLLIERLTWLGGVLWPHGLGEARRLPCLSLRDGEEMPLPNRTMMCPDPLSNVRLPLRSTALPAPETPCRLIVFGTGDIAGGNYRCDLSGYLQDTECI